MRTFMPRRAIVPSLVLIALALADAGVARAEMPKALVETLQRSDMPSKARSELDAGRLAVWVFEQDTGEEQLSVVGVVKLARSPGQIAEEAFKRPSMLEGEVVKASGNFGDPASLGDLASYHVPDVDLEALADCQVHACGFKLGARALKDLEAIDWEKADARDRVDALVRARMVDLVTAYRKEGRPGLGQYVDKADSRSVADMTGKLLEQMRVPGLAQRVRTYFTEYPKSRIPGARDRLSWNVRDYGYRPVTSIVHTAEFDSAESGLARLIAAETLYSSHYFYARLQLLGLYAATGDPNQTYAVYGDRLLFDSAMSWVHRKMLQTAVVSSLRDRLAAIRDASRAP
jgi:hypothetical protein